MKQPQFFWIFDRTIWDQIRLPAFAWWETFLLAGVVLCFVLYLVTIVYLDRRFLEKTRFNRKVALLRPRLVATGLSAGEMEALRRLAGAGSEPRLFRFLSNPVAFETRVHEAMQGGAGEGLGFVRALRGELGYYSDNFLVPMVSTRQMRPGDGIRLSLRGPDLSRHHYGVVEAVEEWGFAVLLGEPGLDRQELERSASELFYVRGHDLEYRFPCVPAGGLRGPRRLSFRHALTVQDVRPRQTRLPLLCEVAFRERPLHAKAADALDPELAPLPPEQGVLNDLNDGGFSLVLRRRVEPGRYLEFTLPTRRGKRPLRLMGRVTACRSLPGDLWMAHATLRGMERAKRHLLHQIVMHEQSRRFKTLARIQPRRAHKAHEPGDEPSPSPPRTGTMV